ncbi:GNAT family N-acetyltransferase [Phytoactinopolyspora sp. XMNu-373]|uniref:GNAT family N-acetyltransferase n=2 Tax=Phytoactinopolyspora mesophila TaxID=2650750 RepID=A0A7K3M519_9ACTN|nr:GNAT family N-acetyltransferase [Phytoactinopolyspora mesophila]
MRLADIEALLPLEQELFAGDPPWSAQIFRSELAGMPATRWYVVAEYELGPAGGRIVRSDEPGPLPRTGPDTRIAGYAGLRLPSMWKEPADIHTIAVATDEQRRGIGSKLLAVMAEEARAHGATSLTIEVRVDNEPALAFYTRHGFEQIGVRPGYFGGNRDGLVMSLSLSR